ncbi:MAG: hypothetical protein U0T81_00420 [Saprospiraceae bacterium]
MISAPFTFNAIPRYDTLGSTAPNNELMIPVSSDQYEINLKN